MQNGDFIRIEYVARLENGEIFDLTDEETAKKEKIYNPKVSYRPVPIIVGAGFVIPGLDKELLNLDVGEKKTVEIPAEEGFGKRNPNLVRVVPKNVFRENKTEPQQGMVVDFSGIKGRIQSVAGGRVRVDFNNPLAGKKLVYDVEIKSRADRPEEQAKMIFEFFGIDNASVKFDGETAEIETIKLPVDIKEKISSFILQYVKADGRDLNKVRFLETYERSQNPQPAAPTSSAQAAYDSK